VNTPPLDLNGARVLLVDDTPENLRVLRQALEPEGYSILIASSGEAALKLARSARPHLILLDVLMPGLDGFETCRRLKEDAATRDIPVIFITARAETEAVVEGFRTGGVDYVVKPFQSEEVLARVRTHLKIDRLTQELTRKNAELSQINQQLIEEMDRRRVISAECNHLAEHLSLISSREAERWGIAGFVGRSRTIDKILQDVGLLQNTGTTVLITGESGTGKELIARAIHHGSSRSSGPFIPVNCAAIPGDLAESMLFGHARGAFTGADRDRAGAFELADGGTLFLDEVGDMPLGVQAKLLRVLEDGWVLPLGAARGRRMDVRVLAATNRDLQTDTASGRFRQDLYYRLARFPVHIPPLRERREDIPLLARHFLDLFAAEMGVAPPPLPTETLAALQAYDFPGNIRELKNIIERALIESGGADLRPEHLHLVQPLVPPPTGPAGLDREDTVADLPLNLKQAEEFLIRRALQQTHGNITAAARLLGTNRPRIYQFLQRTDPSRSPESR
jgi:DNA-binding NtrC family response regulator